MQQLIFKADHCLKTGGILAEKENSYLCSSQLLKWKSRIYENDHVYSATALHLHGFGRSGVGAKNA